MDKQRALIAMSGGVDSSVAAALMLRAGYDCIGATMKLHGESDTYREKSCCTASDAEDARGVCARLGMKYYVFNFAEDFDGQVIRRFAEAYEKGFTPNPCIDCNRFLKFDRLYRRAGELGCDLIVTGHYARTEYDEKSGRWLLKKSLNAAKDQTYVLYSLTQEQLAHTKFPLGDFDSKEKIREIARELDLVNAAKRDSQDICFVPDGDYAGFIRRYSGKDYPRGSFIDKSGKILGEHKGIIHYTIGQRKGLGLSFPQPMYVCEKNVADNTVTLAPESELYSRTLIADGFNWISRESAPEKPLRVWGKTRYSAREAPAYAEAAEDGVKITFDEPQRAVTAGQAVVLYDGDIVVGGGTIIKTENGGKTTW